MATQKPWYTYARIDNFGSIDPQPGGYWKPDSNILCPPGYPVTALLPGVVTSVARTSWGQSVVTIKIKPLNSLATHTFYEHMHSATVRAGQSVSAGTLIGYSNYQGEGAALGFGLYSGDVYGSGQAWSILQNDLRPGGAGLLNPVALLNSAASGQILIPQGNYPGSPVGGSGFGGFLGGSGGSGSGGYVPLLQQVHETLVDTPGFYGISLALDEAEQFPGYIDLTNPIEWDILGNEIQFPDLVGYGRSVGATMTDNFLPFMIRGSIVSVGLILLMALLIKVAWGPAQSAMKILPILAA